MVAKLQSSDHGRKKVAIKLIVVPAPSTGGSTYNIGQIQQGEFQFGVAHQTGNIMYNASKPEKSNLLKI